MTDVLPVTEHGFLWQGRHDSEDGEMGTRVHHVVQSLTINELAGKQKGIALTGFCSDAGVARNKGRIGAKQAPDRIRQALANMAWHRKAPWYDIGNTVCEGDALEQAQSTCADTVTQALPHMPVITLGGGHETAWASFQGLAQYINTYINDNGFISPRIGIVNFDAHFDLRAFDSNSTEVKPSSGTPFNQMAHYCKTHNWPFHYACLGVSQASNTAALFQRADDLKVWYIEDKALGKPHLLDEQLARLDRFIDACDFLYLTIDLDVFPAATAPGVSAPAARGVSYQSLSPFLEKTLEAGEKLTLADINEYNPLFDRDSQTARLAARLCWDIACAMSTE